jgi:hypothetical protein
MKMNQIVPPTMSQTTESLVSTFNQDELSALMTAMGGYINTKNKQKRSTGVEVAVFCKLVDALMASNYLNAVEIFPNANAPMGSAEYKAYEAMYESDVRAHS